MKKTHPSPRYILLPAIILLILGAAAIPFYLLPRTPRAMEEDLSRISSGDYNAAFLSTYPIETYQEEDFSYYRGLSLFKASYCIPSLSVLQDYMEAIVTSGSNIVIVYLGLDPDLLSAQEVQALLAQYPSVQFEIILSYPSAQHWQELSQDAYETSLAAHRSFLLAAPGLGANTAVYFYGTQEWLVSNPGNYGGTAGQLTEPMARTVSCTVTGITAARSPGTMPPSWQRNWLPSQAGSAMLLWPSRTWQMIVSSSSGTASSATLPTALPFPEW